MRPRRIALMLVLLSFAFLGMAFAWSKYGEAKLLRDK